MSGADGWDWAGERVLLGAGQVWAVGGGGVPACGPLVVSCRALRLSACRCPGTPHRRRHPHPLRPSDAFN